jgi:F-type H+-transporting ATPase subunit b
VFFLTLLAQVEVEQRGFGLNFNILETNLINILLVGGLVIYLARGYFSRVLGERRRELETRIQEVEERARKAEQDLAEAKRNLSTAEAQAQQILAESRTNAARVRQQILDQAELDIARVRESADRDLQTEQQRILTQVRLKVVRDALAKLQQTLPGELNEETQRRLVDQSIQRLG